MDASIRFRIATRIHHALIRELGEGIDVVMMLGREPYAREVLHVCNACGNRELVRLARHFRAATEQEERAQREEAALHAAWMRNTSGFRATQPPSNGIPAGSTAAAGRKPGEAKRSDMKRVSDESLTLRNVVISHNSGSAATLSPRRWFGWFGLGVH